MEKYDTSQLTEFPRFEPESSQSGVSTFFNKLWKFPLFTPSENAEASQNKNDEDDNDDNSNEGLNRRDSEDVKTELGSYAVELEGRSLPNVLRRISSLIALGSKSGTRYADTELARYWMPDDISRECYECAARFSTLRRRHHCRVCGQIFCSRCCSQRVPGHIFGCAGGLRVCNYCCNVVLSYLKENDLNGEISPDLKTLQENLQVKFPENKDKTLLSQDNFVFARDQEERCDNRNSSSEAIEDVFRQLTHTLPTQQHRYRLLRYSGVWRGADILQWVMDNTNSKTRIQATLICQNLLSGGYLECVTEVSHFADYALYRPITLPRDRDDHIDTAEESEESSRLVESVSSYCLDLNLGDNSARLIKTSKADVEEPKMPVPEDSPDIDDIEESKPVCKAIAEWGAEHLRLLMRQSLARQALPESWMDILLPLCEQAAEIILPELDSNDIDVRNYVQVKKVPGGTPRDSCLINGVVLTKNVAHRGMPQQISNPTILLLDCSIAYQRVEGKLTSLEPMLLQEHEYLARSWLRLSSLGARVVLARGGAGRAVLGAARAAHTALALRVRPTALRRAARAARADLLTSLDARVGMPTLGTAQNFYVKSYGSKTLMVLEGCANPHLGCCILVRGASLQELIRVKKVVKFMLLACYNWKLEKAFYANIEAVLPEAGVTFDDDGNGDERNDFLTNVDGKNETPSQTGNPTDEEVDLDSKDNKKEIDSSIDKRDIDSNSDKKDIVSSNDKIDKDSNDNPDETVVLRKDRSKSTECLDDPLHKPKYSRKTENSSCGVPIRDFSDPLRASVDDDVFLPKEETTLVADTQSERWWGEDVAVSMSPWAVAPGPFLESEAGRRCALRRCFPRPLLPPPAPAARHAHAATAANPPAKSPDREVHPFIRMAMDSPADDISVRTALAHYRATGNIVNKNEHQRTCPQYKQSIVRTAKEREDEIKDKQEEVVDPYAPENHQKLHVLLYSYSHKSANVPDFCVNPWVMTMEAYGRHDISLGAFLDKYCFNPRLACSSPNCQVPVNQHVRKFVHGDACITITCNTVGHSNSDKLKEEQSKQMSVWWRCEWCGSMAGARRVGGRARRVSLGVWLRARTARRPPAPAPPPGCPHAPHHATMVFQRGLTSAVFRYSKISFHEIVLPPDVITTHYDTKQMRDALISQLNELMLKGHETFSAAGGEAEREQQQFRHHMEQLHVAVSAPALREPTSESVVRSLWSISDGIIFAEKMLRDVQDKWSSPPAKAKPPHDTTVDEKSDLEDAAIEDSTGTTYVFASDNTNKDSEKEHTGQDEDEEKGDKKTIRQILSQLLSSNQSANQGGMISLGGAVPVVVHAHQTGSVIAAALAAHAQRARHRKLQTMSEQEDLDTNSTGKDKVDGDKNKAAKSNEHVEILLKDGLLCRIYYAAQFQALRHAVIAPLSADEECCCDDDKKLCSIEEGFIRSLAHCVPWATRGGKSGSTFCKTKDDRYVLKEMTKPEWQQFLEFAPHYFNYVMTCRQNNTPSVLARMVGVYSVGGAGAGAGGGVLVLEHVWYRAPPQRYDLKGTARHRHAPPPAAPAPAHSVLMDENLLNLRWERALFVRGGCARALWRCLERDTAFLAAHDVMDYSLLLAHDDHTLVLGIIDYIRTFTWDKKLEHLVKKNLGSGQPTVVSPAEYRARFCTAARKYFLQCPEHWDHLYDVNF